MKHIKVTFTRRKTYEAIIKVSDEEFEQIKEIDNEDIPMYEKNGNRLILNPQYQILEDLDTKENEIDCDDEIYDVFVKQI